MKNLEAVSKILEIHMTHQSDRFIKIDQDYYIQQVLVEFDMKHMKKALILLSLSINLKDQKFRILNIKDHEIFRCLIRRLMFMTVVTRINIAFTVNHLSQYLSESQEIHLQVTKHALYYLVDTTNLDILYEKITDESLAIYTDAVYMNACKFKSTTDYCVLIFNSSVI